MTTARSARPLLPPTLVEVCCDSISKARSALSSHARRIELCTDIPSGGFTPDVDTLQVCAGLDVPVHVLIRPGTGGKADNFFGDDFVYSRGQAERMLSDIALCGELAGSSSRGGIRGVVIGALSKDGRIDIPLCRELVEKARLYALSVTFHRAVDVSADPLSCLDEILSLEVDRVLSSGGCQTALEGMDTLSRMNAVCAKRGAILIAAGGIREANVDEIVEGTGVMEVHSSSPEVATHIWKKPARQVAGSA